MVFILVNRNGLIICEWVFAFLRSSWQPYSKLLSLLWSVNGNGEESWIIFVKDKRQCSIPFSLLFVFGFFFANSFIIMEKSYSSYINCLLIFICSLSARNCVITIFFLIIFETKLNSEILQDHRIPTLQLGKRKTTNKKQR